MAIPPGSFDLAPLIPAIAILVWGGLRLMSGPFGQALVERLRGSAGEELREDVELLREDLGRLSGELVEMREQLEFTERMLAQGKVPPVSTPV